MSDFLERIVEDLRSFAPELLEPGIDEARRASLNPGMPASLSSIVRAVESFRALLPRLVEECSALETSPNAELVSTLLPRRASPSRRPSDYGRRGQRVVPLRFETLAPRAEPDHRALRYLLHWTAALEQRLAPVRRRTEKQIETARLARAGGSVFAREDEEQLQGIVAHLDAAGAVLQRARATLREAAGVVLRPSEAAPRPFPRSPAWRSFDRITRLGSPGLRVVAEEIRAAMASGARSANLPYLYQRWCGVHLVRALEHRGLRPAGDVVGALFLGGRVEFRDERTCVDLWVEPRLGAGRDHPMRFRSSVGDEATPDYVLVVAGPQGPDAFVLDATKTADPETLQAKFKYLSRIESARTRLVAGVPVTYGPLRSWAAAPIGGTVCRLESRDGTRGIIPMHPAYWSEAPIRAWVGDVVAYARAWGAIAIPDGAPLG
ncbi:MAG: hypothetical protein IPN34_16755 [Planctomycetes bacterium]|nr:hypothetical protein [Planctomycetota bacterium]